MVAVAARDLIKWSLIIPVIVTLTLGWKYPLLGFIVPVTMIAGIIGGVFRGRYVCGNLCPRGSFLDNIISPIGHKKNIPVFFTNPAFRWALFILLMGLMGYRISLDPGNIRHWGAVFVLMCFITTALAVIIGIFIRGRTWCSFCPMGTMQMVLGTGKYQLPVEQSCVGCELCLKSCPFSINAGSYREEGKISHPDCLKCHKCVEVCPKQSIKKLG